MRGHRLGLSERQLRALRMLGPSMSQRGFYLAGGTAIAIHLGHRRSIDLDWFTEQELDDPRKLAAELQQEGLPLRVRSADHNTLHGTVMGVKVSFIRYHYDLLQELEHWSPFRTDVAALRDIVAMKLSAIENRGSKKDFVDIFCIERKVMDFETMLEAFRNKFGTDEIHGLLRSLIYFQDADRQAMPKMLWNVDWRQIKTQFRQWAVDASEL